MSSLVTQQNKELLWGVLAEEGIFDSIPSTVTPQEIKHVFEHILRNLSTNIPAIHAGRLKELHQAKHKAIAEEDYDTAKKIRATISEMEALMPRLEKLEQRKQLAVQAEDFETAKQLKNEIDRIHAATVSLKELNKVALQSLVIHIPRMAREMSAMKMGGGSVVGSSSVGLVPQVREIYNAEDFHTQKREEIETKLREKEAEMRSYLEVPRPQEIDFSDVPRDSRNPVKKNKGDGGGGGGDNDNDNDNDNDSPLATNSDDMEKIIAERIAARQRDLDEITERMKATNPPPHAAPTPTPTPREYTTRELDIPTPTSLPVPLTMDADTTNNARRVRFQEDNPILLKLKKKPAE
jgi:excinuclease UvrABC nuclease subunit